MSPLEVKIAALIAPAVGGAGFDLIRVRVTGSQRRVLQVMAERPDKTMTAEDCALLSRALSALLDEADPIAGAYALEVSSPGIDRPLTRLKDFDDWRGYEAKIEIDGAIDGKKRFHGALAGTAGDHVRLAVAGEEETALIPFARIATARLVLTEELIRESLRAAKDAARERENVSPDGERP